MSTNLISQSSDGSYNTITLVPFDKGLFVGGFAGSCQTNIDRIDIMTTMNAISFGSLQTASSDSGCLCVPTKCLVHGGYNGSTFITTINLVQPLIASTSVQIGNISTAKGFFYGGTNLVRGLLVGGKTSSTVFNTIEYTTISDGNTTSSFGTLITQRCGNGVANNSHIMLVACGLNGIGGAAIRSIEYVRMATTSNGSSFGDCTTSRYYINSVYSYVRAIFAGDNVSPYNTIDYVTMSTLASAVNFGRLSTGRYLFGAASNLVRGTFAGGYNTTYVSTIDYITLTTTSNSTSFGSLTLARRETSGASTGHAGCWMHNSNWGKIITFGGWNISNTITNIIEYHFICSPISSASFGNLLYSVAAMSASSSRIKAFVRSTQCITFVNYETHGNAQSFINTEQTVEYQGYACNDIKALMMGGNIVETSTCTDIVNYFVHCTETPLANFGILSAVRRSNAGSSSPTRALLFGGTNSNMSTNYDMIEYFTFSTTSNYTSFGNMTSATRVHCSLSSNTRAISGGGISGGSYVSTMNYVTIATTGNAVSFGSLTSSNAYLSASSDNVYGSINGGHSSGSAQVAIQRITIATTGNSSAFSSLKTGRYDLSSTGDYHGGLCT